MDKEEAQQLIVAELDYFRAKPYVELIKLINAKPVISSGNGPSGKQYQIEIQAF